MIIMSLLSQQIGNVLMTTKLEAYETKLETMSAKAIQDSYNNLRLIVNKNDLTISKIEFIKQNYSSILKKYQLTPKKEYTPKSSTTASSSTANSTLPYHVVVARKLDDLYKSSLKRNKEFNLELNDIHHLLQQETCFYTREGFSDSDTHKRTIDRVDHMKGYVKGNVVACTDLANNIKNQLFEQPTRNLTDNVEFMYTVSIKVLSIIKGE